MSIPQVRAAERSLTPEIREWLGNLSDDALHGLAMAIGVLIQWRTGRKVHMDLGGLTFTVSAPRTQSRRRA